MIMRVKGKRETLSREYFICSFFHFLKFESIKERYGEIENAVLNDFSTNIEKAFNDLNNKKFSTDFDKTLNDLDRVLRISQRLLMIS